jgi:hypothetical protein
VSHTGAANGLNQSFLDDTVLNVQGQFARTLLGSTPAHTVGIAGNVTNLSCLYPHAFLRQRSGTVVRAILDYTHFSHFMADCILVSLIAHVVYLLLFWYQVNFVFAIELHQERTNIHAIRKRLLQTDLFYNIFEQKSRCF